MVPSRAWDQETERRKSALTLPSPIGMGEGLVWSTAAWRAGRRLRKAEQPGHSAELEVPLWCLLWLRVVERSLFQWFGLPDSD